MAEAFSKLDWFEACLRGATDLTGAEFRVMSVMWSYSDSKDGGSIRPGMKLLGNDTGSTPRTVRDAIKVLIEKGYIELTQKGGNEVRKGWANVYRLGIPHRLAESTRGALPGSLGSSQGVPNESEGVLSEPSRGALPTPQGVPSGGAHPVIDPVINPVINLVTSNPSELPDEFNLKSIGDVSWRNMSKLVQRAGEAKSNANNGVWDQDTAIDNYEHAMDLLSWQIRDVAGDDAQTFFIEKWTIPAKARDRYEAGKNLKTFFNTCRTQGVDYAPASKAG